MAALLIPSATLCARSDEAMVSVPGPVIEDEPVQGRAKKKGPGVSAEALFFRAS
jgi:hypothetical protein